jgi:hypothetical protein
MVEVTYQCTVVKSHTRKVPDYANAAPYCCGKPMNKMQTAPSSKPQSAAPTTTAKPAAIPAAPNAPKPQGPTQGMAGKTDQQLPKK